MGRPFGSVNEPVAKRFWRRVLAVGNVCECWEWAGCKSPLGYGRFCIRGSVDRDLQAHRVAYEMTIGPIPSGLSLDHLCRNPACVNPWHLEPVTHLENVRRGNSKFNKISAATRAAQIAKRLAKTHCPRGHEYTVANTRLSPKGGRSCKACAVALNRIRTAGKPRKSVRQYLAQVV